MKEKKLWIFNHYATDGSTPGGARHFELAKQLRAYGWSVTIFRSAFSHSTGKNSLRAGQRFRIDTVDSVQFISVCTRRYRGNGLARIFSMLDYYMGVLRRELIDKQQRPDIIIGSTVHPLAALAGLKLARRKNVPFVFEVRDLWPQTLIDMGRIKKNSLFAALLRRLEARLFKQSDAVIALLPGVADYMCERGFNQEKMCWISNGVSIPSAARSSVRCNTGSKQFILNYLGSLGQANDIETQLLAMSLVQKRTEGAIGQGGYPIVLKLYGAGPKKDQLTKMAEDLGVLGKTVFFFDSIPKYEIKARAREADAFLITVRSLPDLYRYGISMNKIFDYMAASRPTIIAVSALNNPIEESGGGVTVPPEDPEALANEIINLANQPKNIRDRMGEMAFEHVSNNYSYKLLAKKMSVLLDSVIAKNESGRLTGVDDGDASAGRTRGY